jgi:peptidoglycan LD-endopeptidase LytH
MRYLLIAVLILVIALILSPGSAVWRDREAVKPPAAARPTTKIELPKSEPVSAAKPPEPVVPVSPTEPKISPPPEPKISATPPASLPKLIIPVSGVGPQQLRDNFSEARSEGRQHNAMDIMAARGTPVLAVGDGVIRKIFYSERGGNTLYQLSPFGNLVFYYAHLERYADGVVEGKPVKQGEVIGYVGDTGNAGAGNYHLHFAIWVASDAKKFYHGEKINPYPLLR